MDVDGMMSKRRGPVPLTAVVVALCAAFSSAPWVAAQDGDGAVGESTTSTVPASAAPGDGSTTTVPGTPPESTTTTIYLPPLPPELAEDPRVPFLVDPGADDGIDIPIAQRSFDPRSVTVLPERVQAAKAVLDTARADLSAAQMRIAERARTVTDLTAQLDRLDGDVRSSVVAAAAARKVLRDHAVTAYMTGGDDQLALLDTADFVDLGVARSYLDVVVRQHDRLVRDYERTRDALTTDQARLASDLGEAQSVLTQTAAQLPPAFAAVLAAAAQVQAYEAGAHAYVDGFVFPVAAEVEFIDSWGYPRMTGTASAHWHQGTDIFADYGSPLVAAENGVIARMGTGTLGGNKLWVVGESGTGYYYAHLSAFVDGMADGQRVAAGDLVGYVGDSGNARGTSPHLHFEVHPGGGDAVNPYPLLKAAYGNRPVARAVAPTTTLPPVVDPAVAAAVAAAAVATAAASATPSPPTSGG